MAAAAVRDIRMEPSADGGIDGRAQGRGLVRVGAADREPEDVRGELDRGRAL